MTYRTDNMSELSVGVGSEGVTQNSTTSLFNTTLEMNYTLFHDAPSAYVVPVIFFVIFLVGTVGNGTLIYIVARNKDMRSTPNIFIVSLATGDLLLVLASVPFTATYYSFNWWPYGLAICKLNEFLQSLSLGVSVFTLTALSGDRYVAIVYPMSLHKSSSPVRTFVITGCIWALALGLATLDGVAANLEPARVHAGDVCTAEPFRWPGWYLSFRVIFRFVVYFALPLVTIATFYLLMAHMLILSSRQMPGEGQAARQMKARRKVARIVLSFVLVFVVCWLPRHVYVFWYQFDPADYNLFWHIFKITGFCMSFINSCLNPVALYFLSAQFRAYFNSYLFRCCRGKVGSRRCNGERGTFGDNTETKTTLYNFNTTSMGGPGRLANTSITRVTQTKC